jgi:hypothetical protein
MGAFRIRFVPVRSTAFSSAAGLRSLLAELGIEVWIGDAAEIKWKPVRKQKTDRNDARRSPYLVEWKQVPPEIQRYDLDFAEILPEVLTWPGNSSLLRAWTAHVRIIIHANEHVGQLIGSTCGWSWRLRTSGRLGVGSRQSNRATAERCNRTLGVPYRIRKVGRN